MVEIKQRTKIYTVSQVNLLIKVALEEKLPSRLTVRGEISDWKLHKESGHYYFSLKDEESVLPCAVWRDNFKNVKFKVENGVAVLAVGYIDLYVRRGRYSFIVEELILAGVGELQLAFERMKKKLAAEGLFDEAHKKPLPAYPMRIGILTSESGAAIEDIKDSIWNRWPCARLFLYPVPVQGEGAAEQIAAAIGDVNRRNRKLKLDILIVGRGGGSLEDLWAFNEEVLARAIFNSKIPVISAVGHEVDWTIADYVADKRASTPTKAGVVAVPDAREVLKQLSAAESRLDGEVRAVIELAWQKLKTICASSVFRNPLLPVRNREQQLDEMGGALGELVRDMLTGVREKLREIYEQVVRLEPHRILRTKTTYLETLEHRSRIAVQSKLNHLAININDRVSILKDAIRGVIKAAWRNLGRNYENVIRIRPEGVLRSKTIELSKVDSRICASIKAVINGAKTQLITQEGTLRALNPRLVLRRGYSITTTKHTGVVVRTPEDVQIGDLLVTELAGENSLESRVTEKYKGKSKK